MTSSPLVSIGIPVYNGDAYMTNLLDSICRQTYENIEIIISDNASTDFTDSLCLKYQLKDSRIIYHRQPCNIGGGANFEFVLHKSCGTYFMWAAVDDMRDINFINSLVDLMTSRGCLAAAGQDCFYSNDFSTQISEYRNFELTGGVFERYIEFQKNCYQSNGLFYSLFDSKLIKSFPMKKFTKSMALDWFLIIYVLSSSEIVRSNRTNLKLSASGISNSAHKYSHCRTSLLHWLCPYFDYTIYTLKTVFPLFSFTEKIRGLKSLIKFNIRAFISQLHFEFFT